MLVSEQPVSPDFWSRKLWLYPVLGFTLVFALLFKVWDVDIWLADRIYAWEGGAWSLRNMPLLSDWLHVGGRRVIIAFGLVVLLLWLVSLTIPAWQRYRRGLLFLFLSMLLTTSLISLLKSVSSVYCPWDYVRYGGDISAAGLLDAGWASGRCFPSGHASAGYALFALFFAARRYAFVWRWWALGLALLVGLLFGLTQQFRGAHFLSHDLWAASLSWIVSFSLARRMLQSE